MKSAIPAAVAALVLLSAGGAQAEVTSTWDSGFRLEKTVVIAAERAEVYAALGKIGDWWSSAHTYSGQASNMTIGLRPGACFCETLPGGGVKHGEVILAWPSEMLRIRGGFGPLQEEGASGSLTFKLKEVEGGTQVTETYVVGGLRPEMAKAGAIFDSVLGEQLTRFKAYVETGSPE